MMFLSIGGEAREIWEQIGNDNWGQQPFMNAYFNERYMLYLTFITQERSLVRRVQKRLELLSHRWSEAIDERSSIFKQHFSSRNRG